MRHLIGAEFKKLLTIRSTYLLLAFGFALAAFLAFYIMGFRSTGNHSDPKMIMGTVVIVLSNLVLFVGLIGAFSVTHEYRYNTIMYTLTASNSRLKVLLAKVLVLSVVSIVVTFVLAVFAALCVYAGVAAGGNTLSPQDIHYLDLFWRIAFFGWAYTMLFMVLAFIIRNQVGTIVALIFIPGTVEGLLGLWLKENNFYLPFTALNSVLNPSPFSYAKAALIAACYVIVGLVIAGLVFRRRDAN